MEAGRERSDVPKLFFSKEEQQRIAAEIEAAEKKTSAEIVVRVEKNCPGDPLERCRFLLESLITERRTAVIILIALQDHKVGVFGDEPVHRLVGHHGWQSICTKLVEGFKAGRPCDVLCETIQTLGETLKRDFPVGAEDVNELPNQIATD